MASTADTGDLDTQGSTTVGIDLGTTFSAVAYVDEHGVPKTIPNAMGARTTPSAIYFEENGNAIVGEAARNQVLAEPERSVQYIKRHMGDPTYSFDVDGTEWVPEALSALILRQLKSDAEARLGETVSRAVISVPAYFKDSQRAATRTAGEMAGLEVTAIINEPTAAAIAYGLGRSGDGRRILVYDFGGGTFDVTLLEIERNEFTILATEGDSQLGGIDIDELLLNRFADRFQEHHGVDLRENVVSRLSLREHVEQAKIALSARQSVSISMSGGGAVMRADIDREEFSALIRDVIDRTKACMLRALTSAHVDWGDVDSILPVGGSSRIPAVREMLESFGKAIPTDVRVDEAVALGAALRANLADVSEHSRARPPGTGGDESSTSDIVVRDVAPHSLGVRARDASGKEINSVIIPRLTEVPCQRERTYATRADNQARIEIEVLQGEDQDPFSPDVESIGRVVMTDLPPRPAGDVVVSVTLGYDGDGLVEVVAKELVGGTVARAQLMRKSGELSVDRVEDFTARVGHAEAPELVQREATLDDQRIDPGDDTSERQPIDYYELLAISSDSSGQETRDAIEIARETFRSQLDAEDGDEESRAVASWALAEIDNAERVLLTSAEQTATGNEGSDEAAVDTEQAEPEEQA